MDLIDARAAWQPRALRICVNFLVSFFLSFFNTVREHIKTVSNNVSEVRNSFRGWYGDFDIAEPAPNDYGTVK